MRWLTRTDNEGARSVRDAAEVGVTSATSVRPATGHVNEVVAIKNTSFGALPCIAAAVHALTLTSSIHQGCSYGASVSDPGDRPSGGAQRSHCRPGSQQPPRGARQHRGQRAASHHRPGPATQPTATERPHLPDRRRDAGPRPVLLGDQVRVGGRAAVAAAGRDSVAVRFPGEGPPRGHREGPRRHPPPRIQGRHTQGPRRPRDHRRHREARQARDPRRHPGHRHSAEPARRLHRDRQPSRWLHSGIPDRPTPRRRRR